MRPVLAPALEADSTETAVPRYWRISALARQLGAPRQAVYAAIKRDELPAVRLLGSLRVREDHVLAYIAKCEGRR